MIMVQIPFCHRFCDDLQRSHKHKISKASLSFYSVSTSLDKIQTRSYPVSSWRADLLQVSLRGIEKYLWVSSLFKIWIHYYLKLLWWFEKLQISCHVPSQKLVCWVSSELYVFIISYPCTASMQLKWCCICQTVSLKFRLVRKFLILNINHALLQDKGIWSNIPACTNIFC